MLFLFGITGLCVGLLVAYRISCSIQKKTWEKTEGQILSSKIHEIDDISKALEYFPELADYGKLNSPGIKKNRKGPYFFLQVNYIYQSPEGEHKGSNIYKNLPAIFDNPKEARQMQALYKPRSESVVYYDPENPKISVLQNPSPLMISKLYWILGFIGFLAGTLAGMLVGFYSC